MPHRGYTVRKDREGWGVYQLHTGEPVRVNGRVQTGLPRETAAELASALKTLNEPEAASGERLVRNSA
ncbi:hypothetical protein [Methylobacterium nodulans]|uniref:Uncharacterized protein n=1 Tax=Methylobacterium nodulans (strain LMG 21967 / CNCM I-2342 / ORS 2060) TaxID=460265 RepID=B8IFL3_METNO|nr:hypothetical protein [Methylobacterium nodulans]ACL57748.1 conserved hypothetical protein [Methylobacterium nodulans ORS 2060]